MPVNRPRNGPSRFGRGDRLREGDAAQQRDSGREPRTCSGGVHEARPVGTRLRSVRRVARTPADLGQEQAIAPRDVAEALRHRPAGAGGE